MEIANALTIIGIVVGLGGSILVVYLSDMHVFQVYPNFDVRVNSVVTHEVNFEGLIVNNTGPIQAKNAVVYAIANGPIKESGNLCLETTTQSNMSASIFRINFEKMSTGIACDISFAMTKNTTISSVVITADDAPGRTYFPAQFTSQSQNATTAIFFEAGNEPINQLLFKMALTGSIIELIFASLYFIVLERRSIKTRKEYEVMEKETKEELNRAKDEYDFLFKNTSLQESVPTNILNRMTMLQNLIMKKTTNLDEIRSKMHNSKKSLQGTISDFYNKWMLLEKTLIDFEKKYQHDVKDKTIPFYIIEHLEKIKILSQNDIETINSLHKFRNLLAHGITKPNKKEMELRIKELTNLSDSLKYDLSNE